MTKTIENLSLWTGMSGSDMDYSLLSHEAEAIFEYDKAQDWRPWDALSLEVYLPKNTTALLTFRIYPISIGRPEYIPYTMAAAAVSGEGWTSIEVSFDQFDYSHATPAFWRMVSRVGVKAHFLNGGQADEIQVRRLRLKTLGRISLHAQQLSRSAEPGETVVYDLTVRNETDETQAVALGLERYGYESMELLLEPKLLLLGPGQSGMASLQAAVHDGVAPGGFEKHDVTAIPNGNANYAKRQTLYTVRKLRHPYIIHTEAGWEQVKRNAKVYDWAMRELDNYIRMAEEWVVPEAQGAGKPHAFDLSQRFKLHAAGVAWKLTGRADLLEKAVLFLRRFADPLTGYPATDAPVLHIYASREERALPTPGAVKVSTGGLIHEGEMMLDIASIYDLVYDAECWTEEDRRRIEAAFRLFIEKVDWMITDGDTNNIPSGGMVGAFLCSLVIQDMHWIQRFLHGPGGFVDMVGTGVMDDGWYFEGATNYVVLFADMFTRLVQACEPWGLNLKNWSVPPSYQRNAMLSPWSMPNEKPFLGMSFEKFGPVRRNYRSVRDVWDAMLPFIDDRGILFGANDSTAKDMVKWYDLAYYVWREPKYTSVLRNANRRDLIYGVGELPEPPESHDERSVYADNVGLAMLRSRKPNVAPSSQIQAVVKYGSHGGYHGHFDRMGLAALMRHGRNAYGPLASWFGYHSFMFKMWVQASVSHNMVVVDQRMQEPVPSERLLFYSGSMLNVCAVETSARWSDPPYGGQTPYPETFPEERGLIEGRDVPVPSIARKQGDIGTYSEPVLQRRLVAVTDDYVIVADYLRGEETHTFDCLHHYQGFHDLTSERKRHICHTGQMNDDPYGACQFITDCDWYECEAPVQIRFSHQYDRVKDDSDGRHAMYNENGPMNLHVHSLWPRQQKVMTGWYAEADQINKTISYKVSGDGVKLAEGRFGAWILGKRSVQIDLSGVKELKLQIETDRAAKKTVFWGDPFVLTKDGRRIHLSELPARYDNVDRGNGIGIDYYGGPVHLVGENYDGALPFEPLDSGRPAEAVFDLNGLDVVSFEGTIGGDYPLGNDAARRKTVSVRSVGKEAYFLTILEPHEGDSAIVSAEASSPGELTVRLANGRTQVLSIRGLEGDREGIHVHARELVNGIIVREETAE
ncbi:hypothetical protein [Paenibacillus sp. V4I5]|uniref:hypothetical protein n=1 Tax=Paenibacillus sp. V4I5 TaxID=3042306 RepID=UPI002793A6B1|nr:hypothetical protein [Paenibacillus sp. V4I5]MDQ0920679.1 hypothetical protein [Paenibacillus sp. V4I5]